MNFRQNVVAGRTETVNLPKEFKIIASKERQPGMDDKVGLEITRQDSFGIVAFKAACVSDVEGIASAAKQIKEFIEKNRPKNVIFDFGEVKFFSSGVLGLLLDIRATLKAYNGEVVVSAINPQLHRVFKITNLDKIFRFFADRKSAIKAVSTD